MIRNWFAMKWCDLFHVGGDIKLDCHDRINWQCRSCGRWAEPVDKQVERLMTEQAIKNKARQ